MWGICSERKCFLGSWFFFYAICASLSYSTTVLLQVFRMFSSIDSKSIIAKILPIESFFGHYISQHTFAQYIIGLRLVNNHCQMFNWQFFCQWRYPLMIQFRVLHCLVISFDVSVLVKIGEVLCQRKLTVFPDFIRCWLQSSLCFGLAISCVNGNFQFHLKKIFLSTWRRCIYWNGLYC